MKQPDKSKGCWNCVFHYKNLTDAYNPLYCTADCKLTDKSHKWDYSCKKHKLINS